MSEEDRTQGGWYILFNPIYGGLAVDILCGESFIFEQVDPKIAQQIVTAVNNHEALEGELFLLREYVARIAETVVEDNSITARRSLNNMIDDAEQLLTQIETNTNKQKDVNDE